MLSLPFLPILIYIIGVLGLSKSLRSTAVSKLIEGASLLDGLGGYLKDDLLAKVFPKATAPLIEPVVLQTAFTTTFSGISVFFQNAVTMLNSHIAYLAKKIEPDDELRAWRIFGYLFQFMFLIAFMYADLVQMVNNFAILFPQSVIRLPWLENLTVSLLMTSVGTAIAASFIIAEFGEITHFGRWHELKNPLKTIAHILVWFTLACTLAIDVAVALARITVLPQIVPLLSESTIANLTLTAAIAQSFVIVPLLIITFLFLGGIVGIAILYIIAVWLVSLFLQLIHLMIIGIIWFLVFSLSYLVELIFRTILWIATAFLFVFGLVFAGTGVTLAKILEILQTLLNIVYFPMDALIGYISSYFSRRQTPPQLAASKSK